MRQRRNDVAGAHDAPVTVASAVLELAQHKTMHAIGAGCFASLKRDIYEAVRTAGGCQKRRSAATKSRGSRLRSVLRAPCEVMKTYCASDICEAARKAMSHVTADATG